MWYEWIFSGIGTTILSGVAGIVIGSIGGYQIGIHSQGKQIQKAKDVVKQRQELEIESIDNERKANNQNTVKQVQKAGNQSEQIQIGGVRSGK